MVNEIECAIDGFQTCSEFEVHQMKQNISQFECRNNVNLYDPEKGEMIAAVDMQKVVMLPRMPGVKKCIFTKRLIAFHMTFAPLGGRGHGGKTNRYHME